MTTPENIPIEDRAERKAGQMLATMPKAAGALKQGPAVPRGDHGEISTLRDLGITKNQSARWQKLAAVPEEQFEQAVSAAKEVAGEVTAEVIAHVAADILLRVRGTYRARAAAALAHLKFGEKPMLLAYAFQERSDAERVVYFAGLCGVRAPVAWFALTRLMFPARFNAGAFSEYRPKGRRAVIDAELRRADQLFRRWLRVGAAAFLVALANRPPTFQEIQNAAKWHPPSEKTKSLWWPRFPAPVMPIEGLEPGRAASTTTKSTEPPASFYPHPYPRITP